MGVYYEVVCHDCKERMVPRMLKMGEILLNPQAAAQVGRFLCLHNTHHVELVGDNNERDNNRISKYEAVGQRKILQECQ